MDRKSTSGACHFIGNNLISWFSRKQNSVILSTTEAEYIAVGSCCAQVLWIRHQLEDYGFKLEDVPIRCNNTSVINLTKNLILHSRTKHIEVRHHFIREQVANRVVSLEYINTKTQLVDIFTKPLAKDPFLYIRRELGMVNPNELWAISFILINFKYVLMIYLLT